MDAKIVGWGHTAFGALDQGLEELIQMAAAEAIEKAGVDPSEIDGIWLGHFNSGMVPDAFASSLALGVDERLRFTPATRVENACASGSAAVYAARDAIRAGSARTALVIGVEKMTTLDTKGVTKALAGASYQGEEAGVSFPQIFGRIANGYFQAFGAQSDTLAKIAVKNHKNALSNPLAQMRREVSFEFCNTPSDKNPLIAPPLRLTDCSLISDGAAALVMVGEDREGFEHAAGFRAARQVNDYLPMSRRDMTQLAGAAHAFSLAYEEAGINVHDLDLAEVHDCFTIAELMIYEAMGLTAVGQGAKVVADGTVMVDGALPINLSGALQKAGAELAAVFNMGGSGVANYCSILEARS